MNLEKEINQKKFKNGRKKLLVNIIYTGNWMDYKMSEIFRKYGLTVQQYNILRILRGLYPGPATVNLLIERMLDKMSNASRIIDRLEKKDYVSRKICSKDRRSVDVHITDKAIALLRKIEAKEGDFEDKIITIANNEINILNKLLDKLRG